MLISGLNDKETESRLESLKSYASPGTEVLLVTTRNAPTSVESLAEMELAAPGILERVKLSEEEGADAVIIWGGHDPSMLAARSLVDIPVLAPGTASMHMAAMLSERFSLIVQLPDVMSLAWRQVRDYGLENKCIGIYPVGIPVLVLGNPDSYKAVKETVIRSVDDGADAVCFGCMALNNHVDRLSEEMRSEYPGVVIVHPGRCTLRIAETLVDLRLTHSKLSYPRPPKNLVFPKWLWQGTS